MHHCADTLKMTMSTRGLLLASREPWLSGILHIEYGRGGGETKIETYLKNGESGLIIW
jgi:hypothetical protein